jgi:Tfp pilus assembly protein PilF
LRILGLALGGLVCLALGSAAAQGTVGRDGESLDRARRYLAEGNAQEAKRVAEEMLKRGSEGPDLRVLLGIAALKLRDVQAAEIHLRKALHIDPDHVEARTLLGWVQMEIRRDYPAAAAEYRKVIELKPDSPQAHNNLGVALKKLGDAEGAIQAFSRAVGLREDFGEAWSNRGWAYADLKRWADARRDFERALKVNPVDDGALYGLSRALKEARDYAGAEKALRTVMARSPNFVLWLEWGQMQMVRFYWVLLLVAGVIFVGSRYKKGRVRRRFDGG